MHQSIGVWCFVSTSDIAEHLNLTGRSLPYLIYGCSLLHVAVIAVHAALQSICKRERLHSLRQGPMASLPD